MIHCDNCDGIISGGYKCNLKHDIRLRESSPVYHYVAMREYESCIVQEEYNEWCEDVDRREMDEMWED